MNITLDSNVWEKTVSSIETDENKYFQLKKLISSKKVKAYICEIALSLESITKKERATFWANYEPLFENTTLGGTHNTDGSITIHNHFCFSPNNEKHPGLHQTLIEKLELANALNFKVLRMTNLGTIRTSEIPKEMLEDSRTIDDFWEYAQKLYDCAEYINEIKCGSYEYDKFIDKHSYRGLSIPYLFKEMDAYNTKVFAKLIAEWVDGDSIAAHYAFGNDIFCTEDQAKSTGQKSVFSQCNVAHIKNKFGINILSIDEVLDLVD